MSQSQLYVPPILIPHLKHAGLLNSIDVRVGVIGARLGDDDLTLFSPTHWGLLAPRYAIYAFEPDEAACLEALETLKARNLTWPIRFFTAALWNEPGERTLHITRDPSASSLYPPSQNFLKRMENVDFLQPATTRTVTVTTLDTLFLPTTHVLDFLQIDVQGGELAVLEGGKGVLDRGVLGVLTEVCFNEIYEGQPLFGDLAVFMRRAGFRIMHTLTQTMDPRRDMPIQGQRIRGVATWGNIVFFRDLIRDDPGFQRYTPEQFLKAACLADLLGAHDQALELLTHLTMHAPESHRLNCADMIYSFFWQSMNRPAAEVDRLPLIQKLRPYLRLHSVERLTPVPVHYTVTAKISVPSTPRAATP